VFGADRSETNPQHPPGETLGLAGRGQDGAGGGAVGNGQSSPPTISLPKGGGAIRGMGEKFSANPVTGTGSMSVPISTSPGRSGFGPQHSLSYDSGSGKRPVFGGLEPVCSLHHTQDRQGVTQISRRRGVGSLHPITRRRSPDCGPRGQLRAQLPGSVRAVNAWSWHSAWIQIIACSGDSPEVR
jgi:hypothetical protein